MVGIMTRLPLKRRLAHPGTIITALLVAAMASPGPGIAGDRLDHFAFELNSGYRTDRLAWNIAYDYSGTLTPNIYSELTWDELAIYQVGVKSSLLLRNSRVSFPLLITGAANYGLIASGSNQDSDYNGDNRTLEFSRSNNDASGGGVRDFSLGLGPQFTLGRDKLTLAPLFGYSYHEQNLIITDGFMSIPASGSFPGLDSSYDAVWKGGWAGFDLRGSPGPSISWAGRIEYHFGEYRADADWNLRSELNHPVSYSHYADKANGLVVRLKAEVAVTEKTFFVAEISHTEWQADDGVDTVYFADTSITRTRLNEVDWQSTGLVVGLRFIFS